MRKSMLAVAAAISMISVSSGAVAQSAASLSLSPSVSLPADVRAGADMEDSSFYRGGIIIPALVILAIIGAVYLLTKDGDPASP